MVLHVETTLKTTIQKNLQKYQKFASKISVAEFRYSQTIFLRFTVTLFHSNLDEKITSTEQKVTSNEQKVMSNEQQANSSASVDSASYSVVFHVLLYAHVYPWVLNKGIVEWR